MGNNEKEASKLLKDRSKTRTKSGVDKVNNRLYLGENNELPVIPISRDTDAFPGERQFTPIKDLVGYIEAAPTRRRRKEESDFSPKFIITAIEARAKDAAPFLAAQKTGDIFTYPEKYNGQIESQVGLINDLLERLHGNSQYSFAKSVMRLARRMSFLSKNKDLNQYATQVPITAQVLSPEAEYPEDPEIELIRSIEKSSDEALSEQFKQLDDWILAKLSASDKEVSDIREGMVKKRKVVADAGASEKFNENGLLHQLNEDVESFLSQLEPLAESDDSPIKTLLTDAIKEFQFFRDAEGYLNYLKHALERRKVTLTDRRVAEFFWSVGRQVGVEQEQRMPTPDEFKEWVFSWMDSLAEDDTNQEIGYSSMMFDYGDETEAISLIDLFYRLTEQTAPNTFLSQYLAVFPEIFNYGYMRFGARKFKLLALGNYKNAEDQKNAYDKDTIVPAQDYTLLKLYEAPHKFTDEFAIHPSERWRAATILYEKLPNIYFLQASSVKDGGFKDQYYLDLFDQNPSYVAEAVRIFGLRSASDLTNANKVAYVKAELLRNQPHLKFLTIEEAMFLLQNIRKIMPYEMTSIEDQAAMRATIRIFSSAGPILSDERKKRSENGVQKMMYQTVLSHSLKIEAQGKTINYLWNGELITEKSHSLVYQDNQWQVVKNSDILSQNFRLSKGHLRKDLLKTLLEMDKYGRRIEGVAYEIAWANRQMFQADVEFKGFASEPVKLSLWQAYAERYWRTQYPKENYIPTQFIHRLLLSWPAQVFVRGRNQDSEESLLCVYADENFDMSAQGSNGELWNKWIQLGANQEFADNIKRALDMLHVLLNFGETAGVTIKDFFGQEANREKTEEAMRIVRKTVKYWVEMFPGDAIVGLVGDFFPPQFDNQGNEIDTPIKGLMKEIKGLGNVQTEESKKVKDKLIDWMSFEVLLFQVFNYTKEFVKSRNEYVNKTPMKIYETLIGNNEFTTDLLELKRVILLYSKRYAENFIEVDEDKNFAESYLDSVRSTEGSILPSITGGNFGQDQAHETDFFLSKDMAHDPVGTLMRHVVLMACDRTQWVLIPGKVRQAAQRFSEGLS